MPLHINIKNLSLARLCSERSRRAVPCAPLYALATNPQRRRRSNVMDLAQLERAFDVFGAMDPGTLPFHHAQMFLFIAQRESCTYREIEQRFAITNASASRCVNALSDYAKHKKKALGLVEVFIDPAEGRRYRVRLTKKGQGIKQQILNLPSNGQSHKTQHQQA